jgi:GNAT superfamily N-acetyltransferase
LVAPDTERMADPIRYRDLTHPRDPALGPARRIYETTLDEDERIPWEWLARTPQRRADWNPGQRRPHIVVAESDRVVGFGYGVFLPGYGGYVCYLGVDPAARGRGGGAGLFRILLELFEAAARESGSPLPFVIWESHPPADPDLWAARLRTFEKAGGLWVEGIDLLTPNYMREDAPPVGLQLFLRPYDEPAADFGADRLRAVATGLYQQIYRLDPETDALAVETLARAVNPRLAPAVNALEVVRPDGE